MPFELTGRTKEIHCKGALQGLNLTVDLMVPYHKTAGFRDRTDRESKIQALCAVILEWDFLHKGEPVPVSPEAFDQYLPELAEDVLIIAIQEALFEDYNPLADSSPTPDDPNA